MMRRAGTLRVGLGSKQAYFLDARPGRKPRTHDLDRTTGPLPNLCGGPLPAFKGLRISGHARRAGVGRPGLVSGPCGTRFGPVRTRSRGEVGVLVVHAWLGARAGLGGLDRGA